MKTIGLVYFSLSTGGIQRGASFLVPMFESWGYKLVILTAVEPSIEEYDVDARYVRVCLGHRPDLPDGEGMRLRAGRLEKAVKEHKIDLVIHHSPYYLPLLKSDIDTLKRLGVKTVVHWHSVFSDKYVRGNQQLNAPGFFEVCRGLDGLITLSHVDATAFTLLGCRACCIPYADADLLPGYERARDSYSHEILWIGRFWDVKRPIEALKIVEKVRERIPDATLTMIGRGDPAVVRKVRAYLAARPELAAAVKLAGFQRDIVPFLKSAGVGLLTSRFEGYCHALVEMKMAYLPAVCYAMPYLDTVKPGTGVLQAPQMDHISAAERIADLFSDPAGTADLGREARAEYEKIKSFDSESAYRDFFDRVFEGREMPPVDMSPGTLSLVLGTLVDHVDGGYRDMAAERDVLSRPAVRKMLWPYFKAAKYLGIWREEGWYGFKVRLGLRFGKSEDTL